MWVVWFLTPPARWGWTGIASKGILGGQGAADGDGGLQEDDCPLHLPWPSAVSDKNSRSPPHCARRQAAACTSWAAGLSFSVYRVASILASSCSREVLLMETPARCSARPSQLPGSAGS